MFSDAEDLQGPVFAGAAAAGAGLQTAQYGKRAGEPWAVSGSGFRFRLCHKGMGEFGCDCGTRHESDIFTYRKQAKPSSLEGVLLFPIILYRAGPDLYTPGDILFRVLLKTGTHLRHAHASCHSLPPPSKNHGFPIESLYNPHMNPYSIHIGSPK